MKKTQQLRIHQLSKKREEDKQDKQDGLGYILIKQSIISDKLDVRNRTYLSFIFSLLLTTFLYFSTSTSHRVCDSTTPLKIKSDSN